MPHLKIVYFALQNVLFRDPSPHRTRNTASEQLSVLRRELLGDSCHLERLIRRKYSIKFATDTPILSSDWRNIPLVPALPGPNSYINWRMSVQVSNSVPLLRFLIYVLVTLHTGLGNTRITRQ